MKTADWQTLLAAMLLSVCGFAHASVEEDVETVMNAFMPIAHSMLEKRREFFPYGGAMTREGKLVRVSSYDSNKRPKSNLTIQQLRQAFRAGAGADMYRVTGLFYDVQVKRPDTGARTHAIAIALDHEDDYSAIVFFPYTVVKSKLKLGPSFSTSGLNAVFNQ